MKAFSMLLCLGLAAVITCDAWAKRSEPKKVTPVMYEGVKYIAPHVNGREGKTEALNQETGEKLWDKVIYTVKIDPNLEEDVQWVFITALSIRDGKLLVTNEKGDQYTLDLKTKKVEKLKKDGPVRAISSPTVTSARKPIAGGRTYALAFSTFFGKKMDCRGMTVDAQGNVYLAGSTWDAECPTTEGAYDRTFHGEADMAISKWSPEGKLLWSTLVGSPGHDRPYSVKVDSRGCVYAAGIGGAGMPVSPDAFQPRPLARTKNVKIPGEEYVGANGYIVKLSPDGSKVLWGSYVGNNIECRDLAIDDEDNLYLTFGWLKGAAGDLPASWFANAYCKQPHAGRTPPGRNEDLGVMKVSSDGKTVFWATYIGGTGGNALEASLCVGPDHCPVVFTGTASRDMPTTPDVFSNKPLSSWLGKFSADGSRLIFGTYLGAGKFSFPRTHDVALDHHGNIFATCCVDGTWPTTPGAFQRKYGGGNTDFGIVKLSPMGKLLACTYLGGRGDEINGPDTLSVGKDGTVLITSGWGTTSLDYPVTAGCFQPSIHGKNNAVFSLLSNDLGTLLYSTFVGGQGTNLRANAFGPDGSIWVAGHSPEPEWPLKNAYPNACKAGLVLAKFAPVSSATNESP